jgi:hypothetical protein
MDSYDACPRYFRGGQLIQDRDWFLRDQVALASQRWMVAAGLIDSPVFSRKSGGCYK